MAGIPIVAGREPRPLPSTRGGAETLFFTQGTENQNQEEPANMQLLSLNSQAFEGFQYEIS